MPVKQSYPRRPRALVGMNISRRDFLKMGMKGAAVLFLPFGASGCGGLIAGNNSTQGSAGTLLKSAAKLPEPFRMPLPIPPVLEPIRTDATTDYYRITQKISQAEILPDLKTEIWGYDGIFPGPTIVSRSGRRTVVRHRNELPVPTAVHLHGGVTPPEHDGYPSDVVMPSGGWHDGHRGHLELNVIGEGSFDYEYPLEQPAAALWSPGLQGAGRLPPHSRRRRAGAGTARKRARRPTHDL
jgi:spore coat protein A, manganese oxidase